MGTSNTANGGILPYLALITSQLITSSWHVLGKHVMHQVPYLTPVAYVLIRTGITSCMLLSMGRLYEGKVSFPPLFCEGLSESNGSTARDGIDNEKKLEYADDECIENGISNNSIQARNSPFQERKFIKRTKRKTTSTMKRQLLMLIRFAIGITQREVNVISGKRCAAKKGTQSPTLNQDAIQIIFAGLVGMLLLPTCYTTGLILTNPTVTSVWDGPMIPLGVFCTAVGLGVERMSRKNPIGQIGSLLLTVGGSLIVLLVDFIGAITNSDGGGMSNSGEHANHWQFIRGNIVLMGIVAAYSAMSLLQKQLTHYPPITLTGWMFASGFVGCSCLLVVDNILEYVRGASISGCTIRQAISQLSMALGTSPTFRLGLVYACLFVGGTCFSIMSYASSHLESSVITLFAAIQPPITAVLEWIWEGKELGAKKILGMICVVIGMFCFTHIKRAEAGHCHGHKGKGQIENGYSRRRS